MEKGIFISSNDKVNFLELVSSTDIKEAVLNTKNAEEASEKLWLKALSILPIDTPLRGILDEDVEYLEQIRIAQ